MPKQKKTYTVVGTAPIEVAGGRYNPGDTFEAVPGEVAFLVSIGALRAEAKKKD